MSDNTAADALAPLEKIGSGLIAGLLLALVGPSLNMVTLPPALPMVAEFLGGGASGEIAAQRAQSLVFLGLGAGGLIAGALLARWGLRRCIVGSALIYALAALLSASSVSWPVLFLGLFIVGLAASVLASALITATGVFYANGARARVLGFQTGLSDASAICGGMIAAFLAQFYGWRAPFAIQAAFGGLILCLVGRSSLPPIKRDELSSAGFTSALKMAGPVYLAAFFAFFFLGTESTLLPFLLAKNGLASPTSRAIVLLSAPLLGMLASITYGMIRGRLADRWFVLIAAAVSITGYGGIALWQHGIVSITVASMFTGIGIGLSFPLIIRAAFSRTPASLHGYAIGVLNSSVFFGVFASPLVLGPVMRATGPPILFLSCAAAWLAGGLGAFVRVSRPRSLAHE